MGQQQLLLIVLVIILVGTAIVVGLQVFEESNRSTAIDNLSKDLIHLSTLAMSYYKTPEEMGGGGRSFITGGANEWDVPAMLDSLDDRIYTITSISNNSLEIMGQSDNENTGLNETEGVQVFVELNSDGLTNFRIEN